MKRVDVRLRRGVLVRGTVVEMGSGAPVPGASIQYIPEKEKNPNISSDILTHWEGIQQSDAQGKFAITVLPGPGRLLVHGPQGKYVLKLVSDGELNRGQPGGRRNYAHAIERIEPDAGADPIELSISLLPGATVGGQILDEAGNPIDQAFVLSRLDISPNNIYWRNLTSPTVGDRFKLSGLGPNEDYPIYFIEPAPPRRRRKSLSLGQW